MITVWLGIILVISYCIGSISTAILVGKLISGDDIRTHGSGNAGATNALRTYGKKAAVLVVMGDGMKAAVSCILALLLARFTSLGWEHHDWAVYAAGIGAVLGHNFPLYFKFRGGKGVLVSLVAILFADWRIGLAVFAASIIIMALTRFVSLGSVLGALFLVILACIFRWENQAYVLFCLFLAALVVLMHRTNISRLIHGTESKLGQKKK